SDREPFAALNADTRVMQHFSSLLSHEESDVYADRIESHFQTHGFGLWAVQVRSPHDSGGADNPPATHASPGPRPFIGFIGLSIPGFNAHFTPCVEIGWRLAAEFWGQGL